MKKRLLLSLCFATWYAPVCIAGNWLAAPGDSATELLQRLNHAHWISEGAKSPGRVVYVFTDPNCPFCNDLWKAMRRAGAPNVQIRYLLVAVISADSRGKDAAILESPDPASALDRNERNFEQGGVAPKANWAPATAEVISTNEALMAALHIYGTPGLVSVNEQNEVKVFAGMPDPEQLRTILGKP